LVFGEDVHFQLLLCAHFGDFARGDDEP
jgi:hypothetical protein